jgi:hypothetical protein
MQDIDLKGCVRVSDILKRLYDFGDIDPVVLEAKAKIGTNVHKAIVDDCSGEFPVLETDRAQAYFDSYKRWVKPPIHIRQIPRLFCHDLKITGECDGLLNNFQLIDWKCSASANKRIWEMQAHFYWYLLDVNGISVSDKMLWINLRHQKKIRKDPNSNIGRVIYVPLDPVIYEFVFDENILSDCISEAHKYWEELNNAKVLD